MKIGINAMSTIGAMKNDFDGTIRRLHEGGCDYIESMSDWGAKQETIDFYAKLSGGPGGWDPLNTVKRLEKLHEYGMEIRGMFVFTDILEEQADKLGVYCRENCIRYIVISFPEYGSIDDIYEKIGFIRRMSAILSTYGVKVFQHNHEHDVKTVTDRDGKKKRILDIFLEQLSPDELMLEIDTGWMLYADIDPAEYIRNHIDRVGILHFKDIHKDYKKLDREKIFVACGKGAVDFKSVLDSVPAEKKNEMLYVIDQDASDGDIVEDLIEAAAYLKGLAKQ